ncbi:hypothetical protein [Streptomyces sp. PH10-H1]|uniref:hypothetical protein n=1 Tax=Streptomyces sp. PH10-H1 TaxID=3046212 RepID=UPI0024BB8756|nr:hypothetical protein [Streptomyces sp. PH10-H1]MDJ0340445.1 hypothetical protein [Streptomyces sp. PH10-H1]
MAAVRRQHQREAYAALLTAANTYINHTDWGVCLREARSQVGTTVFSDESREQEVNQRAARVRADVPVAPVRAAASVVFLEGPERIAELAQSVVHHTDLVRGDARSGNGPGGVLTALAEGRQPVVPARYRMLQAVDAFTVAARSHLNGGDNVSS